jgi:hypothetical protein
VADQAALHGRIAQFDFLTACIRFHEHIVGRRFVLDLGGLLPPPAEADGRLQLVPVIQVVVPLVVDDGEHDEAHHLLVTHDPRPGEYYNMGGEYSCTVGEMLDTLISFSTRDDIQIETDSERLRPIDADLQIPDTSEFRDQTGWVPEIPFETTMRDLLEYWCARVRRGQSPLTR